MKYSSINREFSAGNPIANLFVVIAGVLAIGVSVVLGFFAFLIISAFVLIMASIIGLRVWWFKRRLGTRTPSSDDARNTSTSGIIEGEYRVVADDNKDA